MLRIALATALLSLTLTACGGDGGDATPDAGTTATTTGFTPAAHTALPQLTNHGQPAFAAPQVVAITFTDTPFRDELEQFSSFVVGSQWLVEVGLDYGVGAGTLLGNVRLNVPAPATLDDAGVVALLEEHVNSGELPGPSNATRQLVYLLYLPATTQVSPPGGGTLCVDGFLAYHSAGTGNGIPFGFGVIPDCRGNVREMTTAASHELIEAATDPVPGAGWFLDLPPTDHWFGVNGFEATDMCAEMVPVQENTFSLARSWSNTAALAGAAPCVPIPSGEIYVDVGVTPAQAPTVAVGASADFTLTGWSSAETADWPLAIAESPLSEFRPGVSLTGGTVNNGTSVTLTLTVPPGTPPGRTGSVLVLSGNNGSLQPVTIHSK